MNDAEKLISIPEDIIFHSYLLRVIDHLGFVYDPEFALDDYNTPQLFLDGENMLELAKSMIPENGQIKNLGYLPYLAQFACYHWNTMFTFIYPEGENYITPETMSEAGKRFPFIHGAKYLDDFADVEHRSETSDFIRPLNLNGYPERTYPKYQMAKMLDLMLDYSNAYILRDFYYHYGPEEDFYKTTDLYLVWNFKTFRDGILWRELDSTSGYMVRMYGYLGWKKEGDDWIEESTRFHLEIHSKSELRYRYIVLCQTRSWDYGECPYDFAKHEIKDQPIWSVIYESPGWCLGDSVFEYDFKPGAKPSGDTGWQVTLWEPSVIIYPEYPDRLKELLKNEKEERKN